MTRPTDTRGASRRGSDNADLGFANVDTAKSRTPYQPHRPAPLDHGCHCYELRGVAYTRCPEHRPAGSTDAGPVRGACPECARGA